MNPKSNYNFSVDELFEYIIDNYTPSDLVEKLEISIEDLVDELEFYILDQRTSLDEEMLCEN